jgi:chromosome segregation ATPase
VGKEDTPEIVDPRDRKPGEDLTYGQALVELANRVSFGSEQLAGEVRTAIEREHGLYVEPEKIGPADPKDAELDELRAQADATRAELEELRAKAARQREADDLAAARAEADELRRQLDAAEARANADTPEPTV